MTKGEDLKVIEATQQLEEKLEQEVPALPDSLENRWMKNYSYIISLNLISPSTQQSLCSFRHPHVRERIPEEWENSFHSPPKLWGTCSTRCPSFWGLDNCTSELCYICTAADTFSEELDVQAAKALKPLGVGVTTGTVLVAIWKSGPALHPKRT